MAPTYQLLTNVFGERFGTAQGLQLLFRQVSGVAGGLWAATALERYAFPKNFGMTFLVAGFILTFSNVALLFFKEETQVEGEKKTEDVRAFLPALLKTMKGARPLAGFFWVIAGVAWAIGVQGFLVVSALERLKLGDAYAGVFASVTLATVGIGGVIAGRVGDRLGHARALTVSIGVQALAFVLAMVLLGLGQFYIVLGLTGVSGAGLHIGLAGLTARLAPKEEKGAFIAIMRWALQLVLSLATAILAFVSDRAGYVVLFGTSVVPLGFAMFVALRLAQREAQSSSQTAR
jgi:MFS family permease